MRRVTLVFLLAALVLPPAATAGGWWSGIEVSRSRVAVGQRVTAEAEVLFASTRAAAAAEARDAFSVYLLRDFDYSVVERAMRRRSPRNWWSLRGAQALEAAPVALRVLDANLAVARASFTVPDVRPGRYALMFCDAGCARPLADVVPTPGITVMADPATVAATARIERLEKRLERQAQELAAARADLGEARTETERTRSRLQRLAKAFESVERRLATSDNRSPGYGWAYAGWFLAGACASALVGFVLLRRRSRGHGRRDSADAPIVERTHGVGGTRASARPHPRRERAGVR